MISSSITEYYLCGVFMREIARQVRGVKLCRAIKVSRQAAKVESERMMLSRPNLAGCQIALKVGVFAQ